MYYTSFESRSEYFLHLKDHQDRHTHKETKTTTKKKIQDLPSQEAADLDRYVQDLIDWLSHLWDKESSKKWKRKWWGSHKEEEWQPLNNTQVQCLKHIQNA